MPDSPATLSRREMREVLTFGEAANELGFDTPKVLRQAAKDGRLRVHRFGKGPKSDRIFRADLEAFKRAAPCPYTPESQADTWSPFVTTASDIEKLLGAGRTKTRANTNGRSTRKSATLRVVGSRNG
jgi:hypothetical protein